MIMNQSEACTRDAANLLRLFAATLLETEGSTIDDDYVNVDTDVALKHAEENYIAWMESLQSEACDKAFNAITPFISALKQRIYEDGIKRGFKLAVELLK